MAKMNGVAALQRGVEHERLGIFVGRWRAEGLAFGGPDQTVANPRANPSPWLSTETCEWVPGEFFLIQRWDAMTGDAPFQGLGVISYDPEIRCYVSRSYENHGHFREYVARVDGRVWTFLGENERARVEFSADGVTQTIRWEWKPGGEAWLPLCDRTAVRLASGG